MIKLAKDTECGDVVIHNGRYLMQGPNTIYHPDVPEDEKDKEMVFFDLLSSLPVYVLRSSEVNLVNLEPCQNPKMLDVVLYYGLGIYLGDNKLLIRDDSGTPEILEIKNKECLYSIPNIGMTFELSA